MNQLLDRINKIITMTIEMKTEGLEGFNRALSRYVEASSKTRQEVLEHRSMTFAFALFRSYQQRGRVTRRQIKKMPARRMKVYGVATRSKRQEKARRLFAAGFVATGWIPAIKALRQRGGLNVMAKVGSPQGSIVRAYKRGYVELINSTPGAPQADAMHNLTDRAYRNQERDMQRYLERKAERDLRRSWS